MWDMNEAVKIEYKGQYVFYIEFDDRTSGCVDFTEYLEKDCVWQLETSNVKLITYYISTDIKISTFQTQKSPCFSA